MLILLLGVADIVIPSTENLGEVPWSPILIITPDDVKKFEEQLKQLGKKVDVTIYPDAGHAFENPNNKDGYRPQDAADAWDKTVKFFAANLKM